MCVTHPCFVHRPQRRSHVVKVEVGTEILVCRLAGASDTETGTDWFAVLLLRRPLDRDERYIDSPDRGGRLEG